MNIYAPMIQQPRVRAYLLHGQVGGGWTLDIESFLGPVKCIGPIGKFHFTRAQEGGFRAHTVGGGGSGGAGA
jgi:hypothetical protein